VLEVVLATRNVHKTREIQDLLGESFIVNDLSTREDLPEVLENGRTFAENAIIKAQAVSRMVDGLVLADDSGLEVDLLDGAPGVFSARYAGDDATDLENIEKLLGALRQKADKRNKEWTARFRCVLALARGDQTVATVDGVIEGIIVEPPRGHGGFGYDPIFQPVGYDRTFAELGAGVKNRISHRARAIVALRPHLPA
jgi:XTP/dITP diphosphohydrolase